MTGNKNHPMTRLMNERAVQMIALIIWKLRKHLPNLEVRLSAEDMNNFTRAFVIQEPMVAVVGEQDAILVRLVDQQGGKLLLQREDASADHPAVKEMEAMLQARKDAPGIATELKTFRDYQTLAGNYDGELMTRAAQALMLLSGPHPQEPIAEKTT